MPPEPDAGGPRPEALLPAGCLWPCRACVTPGVAARRQRHAGLRRRVGAPRAADAAARAQRRVADARAAPAVADVPRRRRQRPRRPAGPGRRAAPLVAEPLREHGGIVDAHRAPPQPGPADPGRVAQPLSHLEPSLASALQQLRVLLLAGNRIERLEDIGEALQRACAPGASPRLEHLDLRDNPLSLAFYPILDLPAWTWDADKTLSEAEGLGEVRLDESTRAARARYRASAAALCPGLRTLDGALALAAERQVDVEWPLGRDGDEVVIETPRQEGRDLLPELSPDAPSWAPTPPPGDAALPGAPRLWAGPAGAAQPRWPLRGEPDAAARWPAAEAPAVSAAWPSDGEPAALGAARGAAAHAWAAAAGAPPRQRPPATPPSGEGSRGSILSPSPHQQADRAASRHRAGAEASRPASGPASPLRARPHRQQGSPSPSPVVEELDALRVLNSSTSRGHRGSPSPSPVVEELDALRVLNSSTSRGHRGSPSPSPVVEELDALRVLNSSTRVLDPASTPRAAGQSPVARSPMALQPGPQQLSEGRRLTPRAAERQLRAHVGQGLAAVAFPWPAPPGAFPGAQSAASGLRSAAGGRSEARLPTPGSAPSACNAAASTHEPWAVDALSSAPEAHGHSPESGRPCQVRDFEALPARGSSPRLARDAPGAAVPFAPELRRHSPSLGRPCHFEALPARGSSPRLAWDTPGAAPSAPKAHGHSPSLDRPCQAGGLEALPARGSSPRLAWDAPAATAARPAYRPNGGRCARGSDLWYPALEDGRWGCAARGADEAVGSRPAPLAPPPRARGSRASDPFDAPSLPAANCGWQCGRGPPTGCLAAWRQRCSRQEDERRGGPAPAAGSALHGSGPLPWPAVARHEISDAAVGLSERAPHPAACHRRSAPSPPTTLCATGATSAEAAVVAPADARAREAIEELLPQVWQGPCGPKACGRPLLGRAVQTGLPVARGAFQRLLERERAWGGQRLPGVPARQHGFLCGGARQLALAAASPTGFAPLPEGRVLLFGLDLRSAEALADAAHRPPRLVPHEQLGEQRRVLIVELALGRCITAPCALEALAGLGAEARGRGEPLPPALRAARASGADSAYLPACGAVAVFEPERALPLYLAEYGHPPACRGGLPAATAGA
ncbi:unnamed protein product [Prorocentrum cordatum]|nr:unnamed protein product [Polarella glacialis]